MKPAGIFENLPPHCQVLAREIEEACGFEIEVICLTELRALSTEPIYGDLSEGVPGAVVDFDKALIVYPSASNVMTEDQYHHELMHLHLKHVQKAPLLVTPKPKFRSLAAYIDNQCEHLVIYAAQSHHSVDWRREEKAALHRFWQGYEEINGDAAMVRFNGVLKYFVTREYAHAHDFVETAKQHLRAKGHLQQAHQGWQRLKAAFPVKIDLLHLCLEFAEEPLDRYRLRVFDLPGRKRIETTLSP